MLIQVLIIHGQLAFAIALKQGLERSNLFEAHPFRSVDAALDYLRDHVQDVAVVDFTESSGGEIVRRLREIQPNINIIVTPRQPDDLITTLELQGMLDAKFTVRELAPMLRDLFRDRPRPSDIVDKPVLLNRLKTMRIETPKPPPPKPPEALPEMTSLESVLSNMNELFESDSSETPIPEEDEESSSVWNVDRRETDLFDEVLNSLPADVEERRKSDPFEDLVNSMRSGQPHQPLPARRSEYVEFVFKGGLESLFEQIDRAAKPQEPQDESSRTFQKLAREEPPQPRFEESGTVGDLITGVGDHGFREVLSILRDEPLPPIKPEALFRSQAHLVPTPPPMDFNFDNDDDDQDESPAKAILAQALEQSNEGFSLEELLSNIERQLPRHRPRVQPLPSWVKESQERGDSGKFLTTEPDFLPESLPPIDAGDDYNSQFVEQLTMPSKGQPIEAIPDETQWLDAPSLERGDTLMTTPPAEQTIFEPELPSDEEWNAPETYSYSKPYPPPPPDDLPEFPALVTENFNTSFELLAAFEVVEDKPLDEDRYDFTVGRAPVAPSAAADDPRIGQLALSLTEASLELTAEATLLTRHGEIVAYAGQMAEDEVSEIRPFIPVDASNIPSGSNIRFVSAKDSPKNYMLYSAITEDDLIISLVFASTTPLRDIRRQGQRLVEALHTVPEMSSAPVEMPPALMEPIEVGTRSAFTYVWLLEDASVALDTSVGQAINTGLHMQLGERGWLIHDLRIEEDYIYLLAEVPGDTMPYETIRDLKRRSGEIAHSQNSELDAELLWSDGYLVVAPGRPLDVDEIQQFINFERMG